MENYGYTKGDGYTSLQLFLKEAGGMHFILPDEGVSVDDLLAEPGRLTEILEQQEEDRAKIILKLPKFSFNSSFDLSDILKEMGIRSAFNSDADFTGITKDGMAYISEILHQTHIGIDEKGVEAAAFTDITLCGALLLETEKTVEFSLDRPFLFVIEDEGVILFIGVVNQPASAD
jgi:serpin B